MHAWSQYLLVRVVKRSQRFEVSGEFFYPDKKSAIMIVGSSNKAAKGCQHFFPKRWTLDEMLLKFGQGLQNGKSY